MSISMNTIKFEAVTLTRLNPTIQVYCIELIRVAFAIVIFSNNS